MGASFKNWMKMLIINGSFAFKYIHRVTIINILSAIGIPFRAYEHWKFDKVIRKIKINKPPIFILGHWRSGTTHLHNILTQDPQFGYISMLEASFPNSFLSNKLFYFILRATLPKTRPMDNMELSSYLPQEDEMALGNIFPYTLYNAFYFPGTGMIQKYDRYVKFKGISNWIIEKWKKNYYYLLQKTTYNMKGRQLILKNPAHTARIKILLEMFPNAKFIHIYRNPFDVFLSTWNFFQQGIRPFMLQNVSDQEIEDYIFYVYKDTMNTYFEDSKLIPKHNLVEIKYEFFEDNSLEDLEKVYSNLDLKGFSKARSYFEKYLNSVKNFEKNKYYPSQEILKKVQDQWKFTLEKWKYDVPDHFKKQEKTILNFSS